MRIQIPDDVYEAFGAVNPKNPRVVIENLLGKFAGCDASRKQVLLEGDSLAAVQKLLGTSVDTPKSLIEALERALMLRVDGVEVQLTDAQRKKLLTQATAWKREPAEFIAQMVTENLRSL